MVLYNWITYKALFDGLLILLLKHTSTCINSLRSEVPLTPLYKFNNYGTENPLRLH